LLFALSFSIALISLSSTTILRDSSTSHRLAFSAMARTKQFNRRMYIGMKAPMHVLAAMRAAMAQDEEKKQADDQAQQGSAPPQPLQAAANVIRLKSTRILQRQESAVDAKEKNKRRKVNS
jgi:hypothetical protein